MVEGDRSLKEFQILALPGGFTYGDDIAAGKIFANELRYKLAHELKTFVGAGKLVIGICNGFQILVKSGLLPGNGSLAQEASLIINDCGKFQDYWVNLKSAASRCIWTKGLPQVIYLPVAHGEGKFVTRDKATLEKLKRNGQVVLRYCDPCGKEAGYPHNPNGSVDNIAGICDQTGRIFGLMPHPERHMDSNQHPRRDKKKGLAAGDGLRIFENAVGYAAAHL